MCIIRHAHIVVPEELSTPKVRVNLPAVGFVGYISQVVTKRNKID